MLRKNVILPITSDVKKPQITYNNVKNRFLMLSKSVQKGLEPEPKLSDFKIKGEIGNGSFGIVYLATHLKTKVDYAIKAIDKTNKCNIEGKPYFRREIEIMYKLRHANCVRLFGHFEDEQYCYFIMEYISGGNLYSLMSKNKNTGLNIYLVANILRDLISAIYYLHNMDPPIIHRDIKPENILLTRDLRAKLTDFGWSNYINEEGQQRNTFCGTPIYLAPEMIKNEGHDEHVDIWCLGVLLFELLTGVPPFLGSNKKILMMKIVKVDIAWPAPPKPPIDPSAKDLILKILKLNPKERISLENMVKHEFFIKYCPNTKPILKKNHKYYLEPFVVSKEIPVEEEDELEYENEGNEKHIYYESKLIKNKLREKTPNNTSNRYHLDKNFSHENVFDIQKIMKVSNKKHHIRLNESNFQQIERPKGDESDSSKITDALSKDLLKENEKLEKENKRYKLREIGYNQKIEELSLALNNLNQENMLLKLELEKYKRDLNLKTKELSKMKSCHNVNLNLNNQTTFNINTSKIINQKITRNKLNSENNIKGKAKTPEGQRKGRKIIIKPLKPYLKKNAITQQTKLTSDKDNIKHNLSFIKVDYGNIKNNTFYKDKKNLYQDHSAKDVLKNKKSKDEINKKKEISEKMIKY